MIPLSHLSRSRPAFSLIELLLVIFIISLIYFLGFDGVSQPKKRQPTLSPLTLKKSLLHSPIRHGGTLMCIDACSHCYIRKDVTTPFEPYKGKIDLNDAKSYIVDKDGILTQPELGRYQDHPICLLFDLFPNGSSSQLILETKKGVYYLPTFFGEAEEFPSLEGAKKAWLQHTRPLSRTGDFY